jgi:hypothetical protein
MQRFPRAGAVAAVVMFVLAIPASAHAFVTHDEFDVDDFSDPTHIDNPYLPLLPGTQLVLTGTAFGEAHEVIFTVTDVTKVINGVNTVVLFDQDLSDGTLLEAELAFFAQDDEGNVWAMGEYPEEFDEDTGEFLGAPSTWLAGVDGARPGVSMQADPQVGDPPYIQGFAPSVEFEDQGQVIEEDQSVCVAAGCFDDVIVVKETNLADPEDGFQFKFHAAGTGVVRITADPGDQTQEILDLTEIRRLTSVELAEVRATVLAMDQRAYTVAADVYGDTEPAVRDRIYGDDDPGDPDFDNPSPFDTAADPDAPGAGTDPLVVTAPADPLGVQAGVTPSPAGGTSPSVEPTSLLALEELPRTGLALEWAVPLGVLLVGAGRSLTSLTRRRRSA